jgi:filamentous hemagglutinin family protein
MKTNFNATRGKRAAAPSLRRRLLPVLIAGCFAQLALANPGGQQVVAGNATFLQQGNVLSITNTPGTIINWQNFSIGQGEITRFIQQSSSSAVLNRVVGQDPSRILGALQSNGRVFLINPNGIVFGQGAQVNVNGLVASTLNISNEDFLNGRMHFAGDGGAIRNAGTITTPSGGRIYLVAPNIENTGIINAPNGDVLLAAGRTFGRLCQSSAAGRDQCGGRHRGQSWNHPCSRRQDRHFRCTDQPAWHDQCRQRSGRGQRPDRAQVEQAHSIGVGQCYQREWRR